MFPRIFLISHSLRLSLAAIVCCLPALPCWAEETANEAGIQAWIAQLDDDLFDTREKAQEQLEQVGLAALEATAMESQNGSLESSTRAINILLSWSESVDRTLRVAALEKLLSLPNRPKEAKIASALLADAREEEALEAIVALGGYHNIQPHSQLRTNRLRLPPQVVIGSKWKGGVAGLKHLAAVRHAATISFHSAPVDDSVIEPLLDLKWVRRFEFYGTRGVSKAATDRLERRFPSTVAVRSAAQLGISSDSTASTKIGGVVKDSAAEKAGLQVNDLITEFDGEKIQDFETLTARISQHEPGDSVKLTIVRNRKIEQITVTFDRWGLSPAQIRNFNGNEGDAQKAPPPPIRLDRR
ncbi:MAG: PDZ domain-containing protein [Planctomycetes bacterium]|nr:PDZ domain-containing protein [Planctomycetota bacterium]